MKKREKNMFYFISLFKNKNLINFYFFNSFLGGNLVTYFRLF